MKEPRLPAGSATGPGRSQCPVMTRRAVVVVAVLAIAAGACGGGGGGGASVSAFCTIVERDHARFAGATGTDLAGADAAMRELTGEVPGAVKGDVEVLARYFHDLARHDRAEALADAKKVGSASNHLQAYVRETGADKNLRLVTSLSCCDGGSGRHHDDLFNRLPAITASQNGGLQPLVAQLFSEQFHHWSLTRAAHANAADADHRRPELQGLRNVPLLLSASGPDPEPRKKP